MDRVIEEILEEFNRSVPVTETLCPYCTKLNNCTLKNVAKNNECRFSLNPEATKFRICNKQFMIIFQSSFHRVFNYGSVCMLLQFVSFNPLFIEDIALTCFMVIATI